MSAKTITLAYCIDNQQTAQEIDLDLSRTGYVFNHISCNRNTSGPSLNEQLLQSSSPILLIVSDNFLKSALCMHRGLKLLQEKSSMVLPVVVDGLQEDEESGQTTRVETNFDRVSDIIQYINYWQDKYLDLRRQKRHLEEEDIDENQFNAHLKIMREVSSEVGEFLRMLRNTYYVSGEELKNNRFEHFFRFVEDQEAWQFYQQLPVLHEGSNDEEEDHEETDEDIIADIPGMDQLIENAPPEESAQEKTEEQPETTSVLDLSGPSEMTEEKPVEPAPEESEEEIPVTSPVVSFEEESNEEEKREEKPGTQEEEELIAQKEEEEMEEVDEEETEIEELLEQLSELIDQDETDAALMLAQNTLEEHPENTELRFQYALLLARQHDDPDAGIAQLQLVLEQEPGNVEAAFLVGELAEVKGDYLLARNYYEEVIAIDNDFPDAYYRLGIITLHQFEDQKETAAKYFKKAAKKDPQNADANYQYGLLLTETLGKPKKALKYFRETLNIDPHHPFASYDMALLYHQLGKRELAFQAYQRAIANNPELKTPENDQAFHPRTAKAPGFTSPTVQTEHDTIEALKTNISRLEELLQTREQEVALAAALAEEEAEEEKPKMPGSVVFITGATSGIGRATAELFAENGYRLILNGRREKRLKELREDFEDYGVDVKLLPFDVRDVKALQEALDQLDDEWKQIDILINNAGKAKGLDYIHEGRLEHWEEMIDTNIKGLLYLTRAIAPHMVARGKGHIINVGSTAGKEVYPKGGVYCATKFAVEALTKAMRLDLHTHNIRVSQVSPGHVEETEFALVRFDGDEEKARIYEDFRPLTSADIAEAIYWMATRPPHVNVQDILMMGTQQASAFMINRSGRDVFGEEE